MAFIRLKTFVYNVINWSYHLKYNHLISHFIQLGHHGFSHNIPFRLDFVSELFECLAGDKVSLIIK